MSRKCVFKNNNGTSCEAFAVHDDDYCFFHSEKHKEKRDEAILRGGKARKKRHVEMSPIDIKTPQDIMLLLTDTVNLIRASSISTSVANSVGYLANCMFKGFELVNFERRLAELEARNQFYVDELTLELGEGGKK